MGACEISLNEQLPSELKKYAFKNCIPLSATFELTPLCNFSCVMCYVRLSAEQMKNQGKMLSADEWIELARQAKEMGTLSIAITGGEPFTRPDFWQIYSKLNKMGFLISILSNGYLIDETVIEKFREYGMPYMIKLSVYGSSDETYRKICGVSDGFTRFKKAVRLIKGEGIPLAVTATIVRDNADDLRELYQFAKEEWKVPFTHTVTVVKSARGAINTAEKSRFRFDEFINGMTIENLERNKFPPLKTPFAWCSGYRTSVWITWNGNVQLCSFMNAPYSSFKDGLESAWKELNIKLNAISSPAECEKCEYAVFCQRCPGLLCAESGSAEKVDAFLCETAKKLYEAYNKLAKEEQE